jgi:hypothetical protein
LEQETKLQLLDINEAEAQFRGELEIEFLLEVLLKGDSAARAALYTALFNLAAISSNEIRRRENMNPYPGGDKFWIQVNMQDADDPGGVVGKLVELRAKNEVLADPDGGSEHALGDSRIEAE